VHRIVKKIKRHRYIYFEVSYVEDSLFCTHPELIQTIQKQTYKLYSKSTKELGLWVIYFDGTIGILKCYHKEKENVIKLLQSLTKIGIKTVIITTYKTSGTIQGISKKKLNYTH